MGRSVTPEGTPDAAPLILTLSLAGEVQERFEALRRLHFPPARNVVPAHVTVFHALPADGERDTVAALQAIGREGFPVDITGLRSLGRGVAFSLASNELVRRRAEVARRFAGRLTRQDEAGWRPHVTVQNKVVPEAARALLAALSAGFVPETAWAGAFHLWRYRGGPWEEVLEAELCPAPR